MMSNDVQKIAPETYANDTHNYKIAKLLLRFDRYNVSNREIFIETINLINKSIDDGFIPCPNLVAQYYKIIRFSSTLPGYILDQIIDFTNKMFKLDMIDGNALGYILIMRTFDVCYKYLTHITYYHICAIIEKIKEPVERYVKIGKNMINKVILNNDILLILLECHDEQIISTLFNKLKSTKIEVTQDHLTKACKILPQSAKIITYLLTKNLKLRSDDASLICEYGDREFLLLILEQTRCVIDKKVFQSVLKRRHSDNIDDILNICVQMGYTPDIDDIIVGIENKVSIPSIDRFGLILDMRVFRYCYVYQFYSYYTFIGIDDVMIELAKCCNCFNVNKIKKILKSGYVPSVEFMDMLVTFRVRKSILREFMNVGAKVSLNGLENKFNDCDFELIMGYVNNLCNNMKSKDEKIMLLSEKYDRTIKYDINKFINIIGIGKFFGVTGNVTFDDVKMLLWNKLCKDEWIVGKYIVVPDADVALFSGHKYVKTCDINYLVCAYLECNNA